jgi:ABC-2 type transport system ATP-binding protein
MEYLLSTNNLTKQFKDYKAVNNVSMNIKQGEIYGFIGRNGAGKTTFLKMISGITFPTSGEISLFLWRCHDPSIRNSQE